MFKPRVKATFLHADILFTPEQYEYITFEVLTEEMLRSVISDSGVV